MNFLYLKVSTVSRAVGALSVKESGYKDKDVLTSVFSFDILVTTVNNNNI